MPIARRSLLCSSLAVLPPARAAQVELLIAAESFPPFSYMQDGQARGLDWELVQAVLAKLGARARLQVLPWKRAMLDIERGELDAVIGATRGDLNEREELLAFPDEPLYSTHSRFYFRRDQPFVFDGLFTLKGKIVCVLAGYNYPPDFSAAAYFKRDLSATHEQSLRKLLAGRVDLALVHAGVAEYLIQREGWGQRLASDPTPIAPGRLYMGFSRKRGHVVLAHRFGEVLQAYKDSAAYAALLGRYGLRAETLREGA